MDPISLPSCERAPILLVFDDLAPRVAGLLRAQPALAARLIFAPRSAIHAVGAFLHLAPAAALPDGEVSALIEETDPRELLKAAMPNCPAQLYRALDRAGDRVRRREFYLRLSAVTAGPHADALLAGGLIDEMRLKFFEALSHMDPAVAALQAGLREDRYLCAGVDSLVSLLRAHGALRDEDLTLPPRAGLPAVARRIRTALGRIEAPDPGFTVPPPFRLVTNTIELQRVATAFKNCVALPQWRAAQYHLSLLDGSTVFLTADEPPLLAALRRVATGVWHLEQIVGPANAPAPKDVEIALVAGLKAHGLKIVSVDPQTALGRLEQEAHRRKRSDGIELAEIDDDDRDGIAA
ncbi:hypothetical protein ACLF3G_28300 [Falsiroseomonas sp. HC035]|uniref:hypothetical protein n=1 Tax=Falsiroseomonas sp. HC035 TaxID=3390999 RepID=UPI003D31DA30